MLHRALIKTHHIRSLAKVRSITKASEKLSCAVVMKVGRFPGIMVAECRSESEPEGRESLKLWVAGIKRLRYKDFQLLRLERVDAAGRLALAPGVVQRMTEMTDFSAFMDECGMLAWWRTGMGFPGP